MDNSMTTMTIKGNTLVVNSEWTAEVLKELLYIEGISLDGKTFVGRFGYVCYKDIWFWLRICGDNQTVEFDYIYESSPPLQPSIKNKVAAKCFAQELNQQSPIEWGISKNTWTHELRFSVHHHFSGKTIPEIMSALVNFLEYLHTQKPWLDKFTYERRSKNNNP